jgi:hypothetical protein
MILQFYFFSPHFIYKPPQFSRQKTLFPASNPQKSAQKPSKTAQNHPKTAFFSPIFRHKLSSNSDFRAPNSMNPIFRRKPTIHSSDLFYFGTFLFYFGTFLIHFACFEAFLGRFGRFGTQWEDRAWEPTPDATFFNKKIKRGGFGARKVDF